MTKILIEMNKDNKYHIEKHEEKTFEEQEEEISERFNKRVSRLPFLL